MFCAFVFAVCFMMTVCEGVDSEVFFIELDFFVSQYPPLFIRTIGKRVDPASVQAGKIWCKGLNLEWDWLK